MVVSFSDNFQRANTVSIHGKEGWNTLAGGPGGAGAIGINNTIATNQAAAGVAFQETTVPLTKDQWIRAVVGSTVETESGVDASVMVGTLAQRGTNDYGFGVKLTYGASSVRTLQLIEGLGAGADNYQTIGSSATVTLASSGGSDLSVPQLLYFAVTTVRGGVRLRAAVNNEDLDEPDIDFTLGKDLPIGVGTSPSDYGDWYFAFGTGSGANQLLVYQFDAFDSLEALDREQGVGIPNQLTRSEISTRVQNRYAGSQTNLNTTVINEEINAVVAEIWQKGVDVWTFAEPEVSLTIARDSDGFWEAPYYMESVLRIFDTNRRNPVTWHEWGRTTDDRVILRVRPDIEPASISAKVHYRARLVRMDADGDPCVIPRQYSDVIELGVMRNLARDDSLGMQRNQIYEMRFRDRLRDMLRMENHKRQQKKRVFRALRSNRKVPGQLTAFSTTGI